MLAAACTAARFKNGNGIGVRRGGSVTGIRCGGALLGTAAVAVARDGVLKSGNIRITATVTAAQRRTNPFTRNTPYV
ncbi:MAG TPA: hypothetical protein VGC72_04630 [Candidatus Elarobacter sp.]